MTYGVIELIEDKILFGRDVLRCDVELYEPQISGIHTQISRNTNWSEDSVLGGSHMATITDLSTNGTYLNKHKIGKGKSRNLFDGDEIQFISYAKMDKKTKQERKKVSFIFYKNQDVFGRGNEFGIFSKYDLRDTLGTGSFATVKLGLDKVTGEHYAVKEIDKKKYEMKSKSRKKNSIMNEANILRAIKHDNIIKVYDVFDQNNTLYIVLEMAMGGELFQRIIDEKRLSEDTARYIMRQLLDAIMYLHDNKIAHRDLKPENILMAKKDSWEIKITDFGLSRLLEYNQEMLTTMCGTPLFLAPEVLSSKKRGGYGFEVDYWSIGVILYLMLVGHPPYNEKEGNLLELVKLGKFSFPTQTWSLVSPQAKDLVQHLMDMDVKRRYNGKQVLNHPWMLIGQDDDDNDDDNKHNNKRCKDTTNTNNSNSQVGQKRKTMDNDGNRDCKEMEEEEEKHKPPQKKYKNANGEGIDTNQMSMDSFASHNLTPFDSIIDKPEPKRNPKYGNKNHSKNRNHNHNHNNNNNHRNRKIDINPGSKHRFGDSDDNINEPNGNGASFVLKNSISMKEMSLD